MGMGQWRESDCFDGFRGKNQLVSSPTGTHGCCLSVRTCRSFLPIDQPSRCLEINREISTIDVFPVNSNLTFPNEEK